MENQTQNSAKQNEQNLDNTLQGGALQNQNSEIRGEIRGSTPNPIKKWLIIGIVFVALLIAFGGIYLLGKNLDNKPQVTTTTEKQTPIVSPAPTTNPTADWKTYTYPNSTLNFKYPTDWKVSLITNTDNSNIGTEYLVRLESSTKYKNYPFESQISYFPNPSKSFLQTENFNCNKLSNLGDLSILNNNLELTEVSEPDEMNINEDKNARNLYLFQKFNNEDCSSLDRSIKLPRGVLHIQADYGNIPLTVMPEPEVLKSLPEYKTFLQILSTFKFTDQTSSSDTANWKIYTDSKYGISFKYPPIWYAKDVNNIAPGEGLVRIYFIANGVTPIIGGEGTNENSLLNFSIANNKNGEQIVSTTKEQFINYWANMPHGKIIYISGLPVGVYDNSNTAFDFWYNNYIRLGISTNSSGGQKYLDKIISTLKIKPIQ